METRLLNEILIQLTEIASALSFFRGITITGIVLVCLFLLGLTVGRLLKEKD